MTATVKYTMSTNHSKRKKKDTQKYTTQIIVKEKDSNCTYKE